MNISKCMYILDYMYDLYVLEYLSSVCLSLIPYQGTHIPQDII